MGRNPAEPRKRLDECRKTNLPFGSPCAKRTSLEQT
jgi:hypothetical protein